MGKSVVEFEPLPFDQLSEEQRVELVPAQIFDLKKNEPAFIFSRENLRTIRRYEAAVRQLPQVFNEEMNELFTSLGLDINDVSVIFQNLLTHANSWDRVEDACKDMGADLQVFAEDLIKEAGDLIQKVESMDAWDAQASLATDAGDRVFSAEDKAMFRDAVDTHLSAITEDIDAKLKGIRHVKALIDRFGDDISENLLPATKSLGKRIDDEHISGKLTKLELELDALDVEIEKKLTEYKGLVGSAFNGLVFGLFGALVAGGIYGAQAESVRAQKNELIRQREALAEQKVLLLEGGADFECIRTHISDMQFRLVDVATATKNLEDVWVLLEAYAKKSQRQIEGVSTQQTLKRFVDRFKRVVAPWENILGISTNISRLFNEALQDY